MSTRLSYIFKAATALPVGYATILLYWFKQHGHLGAVPWFVLPLPMLGLSHLFYVNRFGRLNREEKALLSSRVTLSEDDGLRRRQILGATLGIIGLLICFFNLRASLAIISGSFALVLVGWAVALSADIRRREIIGTL